MVVVTLPINRNVNQRMYNRLFRPSEDGRTIHPPLFMTAHEIVNTHHLADGHFIGDVYDAAHKGLPDQSADDKRELLKEKYAESSLPRDESEHGSGTRDSIRREGYDWSQPLSLSRQVGGKTAPPMLLDGHHRLSVMFRDKPDHFVPVRHQDVHEF